MKNNSLEHLYCTDIYKQCCAYEQEESGERDTSVLVTDNEAKESPGKVN